MPLASASERNEGHIKQKKRRNSMIKVKSGSQLIIDGRNRGNNIKLEVMAVKSEEPRVSRLGLIGEQMIYFRATFMSGNQLEDLVVENP